ncbi:putative hexosyltransferase [Medicago truncatula]|uniref:Putative hexosyltransferase n=1 Tax=Medicago truncatula TaxID=3880 RepID=A0A396GPP8_MEDTR|nr:putative hexosyltransferase [Medicago truncatula]
MPSTIETTLLNKPSISRSIEQFKIHFNNIDIQTIKFPCVEGGLPYGCENVNAIPTVSLVRSYGVIINSFYELDGVYADYYREFIGKKEWHIGLFSVYNRDMDTSYRGKEPSINKHKCLKWLDTKDINLVVYVCFGSTNHFLNSQLKEISMGLKASWKDLVLVVKKKREDREKGLPEFEKIMKGKGLIIRGWPLQLLIFQHKAIGAFVTHCGWNLTLESVAAGVPMITWPIAFEEFYNEKLVTEVLKIGVPVGDKKVSGYHSVAILLTRM